MGIDSVQQLLTADITSAFFSVLSGLFSLAILFFYSRALALAAIGSILLLAVLTSLVAVGQLRHLRVLQRVNGKLASLVYALLSGIAKLRVCGAERRAFMKWAYRFNEQRHHSLAIQRLAIVQAIISSIFGVGMPIALLAMVALSARLRLGVGEYLAFNAAFGQFQASALAAINIIPALLSFVPAYERMQPILKAVSESCPGQISSGPRRGMIEFRHVNFRYADGPQVLIDISLAAHPGEFIALVGPSGSGKSTCLRLMLGFERAEAGAVLLDGQSVDTLNMYLVRREIGVVLQTSRPLMGDIFHNIIGSLPLTIDDAWRAARYVGLEEEIRSFPMGMFTHVNQRGVSFSGGQRQRLLLARALVNHPRILLLDEATSALDNITQAHIARNLAELGVTRIVVAHRLSTIRHADRIYVLNKGQVVEHGSFETLMGQHGLFAKMAKRQLVDI
jgi:ATP-binding cassette subfamily C protein